MSTTLSREIHRAIIAQAATRLRERRQQTWRRVFWPAISLWYRFESLPLIERVSYAVCVPSIAAIIPLSIAFVR